MAGGQTECLVSSLVENMISLTRTREPILCSLPVTDTEYVCTHIPEHEGDRNFVSQITNDLLMVVFGLNNPSVTVPCFTYVIVKVMQIMNQSEEE